MLAHTRRRQRWWQGSRRRGSDARGPQGGGGSARRAYAGGGGGCLPACLRVRWWRWRVWWRSTCACVCARRWWRRRAWRHSSRVQPSRCCARAPSSVRRACAAVYMLRGHAAVHMCCVHAALYCIMGSVRAARPAARLRPRHSCRGVLTQLSATVRGAFDHQVLRCALSAR